MCGVGAAAGFGHSQRRNNSASANRRKKRGPLTRVAAAGDYWGDERRKQQHVRGVEIAARDFLVRDSKRHIIEAGTAELRIDHRREHTQLAEFPHQRRRQSFVRVARRVIRKQFAPRKVTQRFIQQLLLGGERKLHRRKPQLDGAFCVGTVTDCGGALDGPTYSGRLSSPPRSTLGVGRSIDSSLSSAPILPW